MTARSNDVHDGTTRRFGETEVTRVEAMARLAATEDDRSRRQLVELLVPLANGAARRARVRARRLGLIDEVDLEDLVQEARMEIWRLAQGSDAARGPALPYFVVRDGARLRHYLTSVARRRWPGRRASWAGGGAAAVADEVGAYLARDHAGATARDDALAGMEGALNALPVRQRRVVYLTFYRRLDDEGIGMALGISPVEARQLRRRALQNLRASVGQWHHSGRQARGVTGMAPVPWGRRNWD